MAFEKDRLHELEIACAIKKTSIRALGIKWGVSGNWIREVARGDGQSDRIEEKIKDFISEAKEVVPYSYPDEVTSEVTSQSAEKPSQKAV